MKSAFREVKVITSINYLIHKLTLTYKRSSIGFFSSSCDCLVRNLSKQNLSTKLNKRSYVTFNLLFLL